jgi:hypothetical protein
MKIPIEVAASMPAKTAVPTVLRLISAAPVAITSGKRPRMKATEVIMTARKRICAPSMAASSSAAPAEEHFDHGGRRRHEMKNTADRRRTARPIVSGASVVSRRVNELGVFCHETVPYRRRS